MTEVVIFERAPNRTIWSALVEVADDSRLDRLHAEADRMVIAQRNSGICSPRSLSERAEWSDFAAAIRNEEKRRKHLSANERPVRLDPVQVQGEEFPLVNDADLIPI